MCGYIENFGVVIPLIMIACIFIFDVSLPLGYFLWGGALFTLMILFIMQAKSYVDRRIREMIKAGE